MSRPGTATNGDDGFGMKQRLRELEQQIQTEVISARAEVEMYRNSNASSGNAMLGEAESNERSIDMTKKEIVESFEKSKENLKRFFVTQKNENQRLNAQIKQLKQENCGLQQSMIALQRRIGDLEHEMGA